MWELNIQLIQPLFSIFKNASTKLSEVFYLWYTCVLGMHTCKYTAGEDLK